MNNAVECPFFLGKHCYGTCQNNTDINIALLDESKQSGLEPETIQSSMRVSIYAAWRASINRFQNSKMFQKCENQPEM